MKRLLLLGGGHAHVHVLQAFARQPVAGAQVLLVSPFARQMYSGMVPGLVAGHYSAEQCAIPLAPLAQAAGARFVETSAVALDTAQRRVTLADGQVAEYDVLSLDTGPVMSRDAVVGAREHAMFLRPIEHFVRLFADVLVLAEGRALDVVVVGGGLGGVELAMAFAQRLRGVGNGGSRVALVTGGGPALSGAAPPVVRRGEQALRRLGVTVFQDSCVEVRARQVVLASGARLAADVPVMVLGPGAPAWLVGSGLTLDERGFIRTGPTLQSLSHAEVFAAGDVASRSDMAHAKSGVYAVRAGPPLSENLRRYVQGAVGSTPGAGALLQHLPPQRTLNLLSCGGRRAIAAYGDWSTEGRWVWWWKDFIDRRFIRRYTVLGLATAPTTPTAPVLTRADEKK